MANDTTTEGKGFAMLGYWSIILWIVAFVATNKKPRSPFLLTHLNSALLLNVIIMILGLLAAATNGTALFGIFTAVEGIFGIIDLIGFINAARGLDKPAPLTDSFKVIK